MKKHTENWIIVEDRDNIGLYLSDLSVIVVRRKNTFQWLRWFGVES